MLSVVTGLAVLLQGTALEVVEKLATKGDPTEPFGSVTGVVEALPGVVIVSDDVTPALYQWEIRTNRVRLFAREGRGPGEVLTPTSSARRPGGGFAVFDVGNGGMLLFDRDLQFERRVLTRGGVVSNPKSLAVLRDGSFVLAGGRLSDPRHLHLYDSTGALRRSYGDPPSGLQSSYARIQTAGGALQSLPAGLLFSQGAPLRLVLFEGGDFDAGRVLVEDDTLLPPLVEATIRGAPDPQAGGARPFLWYHDRSTAVFPLAEGRILNVVTRYYKGDSVWDVYTREGRRLSRTVVPRAYFVWDITSDGDVLATYRDLQTDETIVALLGIEVR